MTGENGAKGGTRAGMTGLDLMQRIADGSLPQAPMAELLNFWIVSAEDGFAVFEGIPKPEAENPMGSVHGGWYGAIMDSVMGVAVHTKMAPGQTYTTLEYKVNITRAIPTGMTVRAEAHTSHTGRSTVVADGKLYGKEDGKLYATASTTCIVLRPKVGKSHAGEGS